LLSSDWRPINLYGMNLIAIERRICSAGIQTLYVKTSKEIINKPWLVSFEIFNPKRCVVRPEIDF
jgi:hypothetical protein